MGESVADLVDRAYWQVKARSGEAGPDVVGIRAWLVEALAEFEVRLLTAGREVPPWHPENDS